MARTASDSETHFCRTVTSICARPGMYTRSSSVNEVVHFLSGMHHGLFPSLKDGPMIEFKERVLDPQNEFSNICWAAVLEDSLGLTDDDEAWMGRLKDKFQAFCIDTYGDSFGIRDLSH